MAAVRIITPSMVPESHAAVDERLRIGASLVDWLVERALPLWAAKGVDRLNGGFFEKIDRDGLAVDEPRRTRVVARQIYVFATAARRGWLVDGDTLVDHGLDFLRNRSKRADGTYASSVRPDGTVVDGAFDLYEHAFVLFALAAASRERPGREAALRGEADALLALLRDRWSHPVAGFEESNPRTLPLRSNPHMHLLEATMAWADISDGREKHAWDAISDELVGLCLERFVDAGTGALRECFDGDWRPMPDASGRVVEPGHQFEWAWLLTRWARGGIRPHARAAAARLLEIGEHHGVDPTRGVAIDALHDDLANAATTAKLWPQTERMKAWTAVRESTRDPEQASAADARLDAAVAGLSRYLLPAPAGLWHEQMRADGSFVLQDCRASSLYHIVCAIDVLSSSGGARP